MGPRDPVVCIVGAGPAGLVTAHLLQRAGVPFAVLERQEAGGLRARVRAGMLEHRTVELLGPYGLADPIVNRGTQMITPAGGKGMNMAIQDAVELASGLSERYGGPDDGRRLAAYSQVRLPQVWLQQEFSNVMLSLFNAGAAGGDGGSGFSQGLRRARLDLILGDPQFSRWFAHAYAGVTRVRFRRGRSRTV